MSLLGQVMKMIMLLMSPAAGHIRYELLPGAVLKPGDLIARLELDDPASVTKAQPFEEGFPDLGPPLVLSTSISELFKQALAGAQMILAGKCYICHVCLACRAYCCSLQKFTLVFVLVACLWSCMGMSSRLSGCLQDYRHSTEQFLIARAACKIIGTGQSSASLLWALVAGPPADLWT